ncbi:deoxyribodipyrimidine photo-lyase [Polynucleobacter sp. TUM22923]|jgi:deoxyribodipyrimidine photo-lyase|uniref:cryptochrome/photolyase family protein n=1 Tax=Polynucleobacter sp. TUM22923 TaxID=3022126 RepID=UPI0025744090|nr:deoxyribodipyrimidine photo-lyase [Polynucleobacter sp. TUM22923]BDX20916.1 deoxyribodipyrimidine photo-lyase [Polynucleobacter sp. TUM22923]
MKKALVWLRRDLRLYDNAALHHALTNHEQVWVTFIFDIDILTPLRTDNLDKAGLAHDRRVDFIWQGLEQIDQQLQEHGGGLIVQYGKPTECIPQIAKSLGVDGVYTNRDYEPSAITRDSTVQAALEKLDIAFETFKDQVIFEKKEILTNSSTVFSVFTPYKNNWLRTLQENHIAAYECTPKKGQFAQIPATLKAPIPSLESMGFTPTGIETYLPPGSAGGQNFLEDFLHRIDQYQIGRDFPAIKGVSYLSTHLRFGMLSIRGLVREAHRRMLAGSMGATIWLSELIWRDFYFMILANHPRLAAGVAFKPDYDNIEWESGAHAKKLFQAWCDGKTGYPLIDAAMYQLNQSGYMHNRLRMVVASFLTKDLGIDWRWGEAYFAKHLNDFELSSNNGGWQWASSSGCDAQPYFRIFNPITQSQKFDPEGKFIRRYLPQLDKLSKKSIHAPWESGHIELEAAGILLGRDYPLPVVNHDEARKKTLVRYSVVKKITPEVSTEEPAA